MSKRIEHGDHEEIRGLLIGRTVRKLSGETLVLDNGIALDVVPNSGCGGCTSGYYELDELNEAPNAIMSVEFEGDDYDSAFSIFVYSEYSKVKLVGVSGDAGNGYYGSGYTIQVSRRDDA